MSGYLRFVVLFGCCKAIFAITTYYMDTNCGQSISFEDKGINQLRLYLTRHSTYQKNMHCSLLLDATGPRGNSTDYYQLMLYFKDLDVESSTTCNRDWLEVRDGPTQSSPYVAGLGRLCGYNHNSYVYETSSDEMFLMFTSDNSFQTGGFEMIITRYHTGSCDSNEYECDNGRCINDHLECNGQNPCGDHSDCPLSAGAVAGIIVGALIFSLVVALLVVVVCRRRRRYRRGYVSNTVVNTQTYGTSGYNQPVPQQYPSYPTGQQYPSGQQYPQQPYPQS